MTVLPTAAFALVAAASISVAQVAAPASPGQRSSPRLLAQAAAERPVSLVSRNVVTVDGRTYVPLSDLAKALGGRMECTRDRNRCAVTSGPGGILKVNPDALAAFVAKRRRDRMIEDAANAGRGEKEGVMNIQVTFDGSDVGVRREEEEEHLLLRPNPMMPVEFLGKLLGGQARFDPGAKAWKLPPGDPGCPLAFR